MAVFINCRTSTLCVLTWFSIILVVEATCWRGYWIIFCFLVYISLQKGSKKIHTDVAALFDLVTESLKKAKDSIFFTCRHLHQQRTRTLVMGQPSRMQSFSLATAGSAVPASSHFCARPSQASHTLSSQLTTAATRGMSYIFAIKLKILLP